MGQACDKFPELVWAHIEQAQKVARRFKSQATVVLDNWPTYRCTHTLFRSIRDTSLLLLKFLCTYFPLLITGLVPFLCSSPGILHLSRRLFIFFPPVPTIPTNVVWVELQSSEPFSLCMICVGRQMGYLMLCAFIDPAPTFNYRFIKISFTESQSIKWVWTY